MQIAQKASTPVVTDQSPKTRLEETRPASTDGAASSLLRFRPLLLIPIVLIIAYVVLSYFQASQEQLEEQHFGAQISNLEVAYTQVLEGYQRSAQIIFGEVVDQPEVLSLMAQANSPVEAEQNAARDQLYNLLIDSYEELSELNLRQLHFHLPDNTSFLRFHRPDRYGDNLTDVRYTIMVTNRDLVPMVGFEEGRIYNGFRYLFPLFYEGTHVGSVETSVSFTAVQVDLNQSLEGGTTFILKSEVVDAKVFEDEQSNYVISDISEAYAYDRAVVESYADEDMPWATIEAINAALDSETVARLNTGESFTAYVNANDENYNVSFLAVNNVQDQHVGYVLSYKTDEFIATSRANFTISQVTIGVVGLALILFFFYLDRSTAFINRQRLQLAAQNVNLEQTNKALDEARVQAEAANTLKSQFLANMSHELRTPLNAILNFSRFVSEGMLGDVNTQQVETLGKVSDNGKHLLSLINDLLDISKIEANQLKLFLEDDVDLQKEFGAVTDVARSMLTDKPVKVVTYVDPDLPLILADRRRIRQIMLNLVSNACKFTDEGQVNLSLKRDGDNLVFSVADTGPGIAKEDHELIFETFRQTQAGLMQGTGTGLGLPISRRLAEIHGGSLTLESELGQGASFIVSLPIRSAVLVTLKDEQDMVISA